MTYQLEHKKQPQVVSVTAEFKGRPQFFEVGITRVQVQTGVDGIKEPREPAKDEHRPL